MTRRVQLRDLLSDRFLDEVHHLLWIQPSLAGATLDVGWNCRDHAWVTAFLSLSLGFNAGLVSGEAYFVKGPAGKTGGASFSMTPHSWIMIADVGAVDLSVRAVNRVGGDEVRLPIKCVFADECIPRGRSRTYFLQNPDDFARMVEKLPERGKHASAVYRPVESEYLHAGHLSRAAGWIGSPLTRELDRDYGNPSDLYAALLLHLSAFLEGRAGSLAGLSQQAAWARLAGEREGAIERARLWIESLVPPVFIAGADGAAGCEVYWRP